MLRDRTDFQMFKVGASENGVHPQRVVFQIGNAENSIDLAVFRQTQRIFKYLEFQNSISRDCDCWFFPRPFLSALKN